MGLFRRHKIENLENILRSASVHRFKCCYLASGRAAAGREAVWSERVICIDMSRDGLVLAVGAAAAGWENTKYYRILLNIAGNYEFRAGRASC